MSQRSAGAAQRIQQASHTIYTGDGHIPNRYEGELVYSLNDFRHQVTAIALAARARWVELQGIQTFTSSLPRPILAQYADLLATYKEKADKYVFIFEHLDENLFDNTPVTTIDPYGFKAKVKMPIIPEDVYNQTEIDIDYPNPPDTLDMYIIPFQQGYIHKLILNLDHETLPLVIHLPDYCNLYHSTKLIDYDHSSLHISILAINSQIELLEPTEERPHLRTGGEGQKGNTASIRKALGMSQTEEKEDEMIEDFDKLLKEVMK